MGILVSSLGFGDLCLSGRAGGRLSRLRLSPPGRDTVSLAWPYCCEEFHQSPSPTPHPGPRKFSYFLACKRFNFMWSNPSIFSLGPHFTPFKLGEAPHRQGSVNLVYLMLQEGLEVWCHYRSAGGGAENRSLERAPSPFLCQGEGRGLPSALPPSLAPRSPLGLCPSLPVCSQSL